MTTHEQRSLVIKSMALAPYESEFQRAEESEILEPSDVTTVFAVAASMSALYFKDHDREFSRDVGGYAIRTITEMMKANGVVPRL